MIQKGKERDIFENYERRIFSKVDDSKRRRYLYLERRGIYLRIMRGRFLRKELVDDSKRRRYLYLGFFLNFVCF